MVSISLRDCCRSNQVQDSGFAARLMQDAVSEAAPLPLLKYIPRVPCFAERPGS
jgi:hypothetical protein